MYEDVLHDLVRQLAAARGQEAARIRMRIKEVKELQKDHATP